VSRTRAVAPDSEHLLRLRSTVCPALPTVLVSSSAVCLAGVIVVSVAPWVGPLTVVLSALVVSPVFAALVAQAQDIVGGRDPSAFSLPGYIRRYGRLGIGCWLPPALTATCGVAAVTVGARTGSSLFLVPAGLAAAATTLLMTGALVGLPLAVEFGGLRGPRLLVSALHVAASRPTPVLGVLALVVCAGWGAVHISASIALLLPGPLALVVVVAVWTSAEACGIRPAPRTDRP